MALIFEEEWEKVKNVGIPRMMEEFVAKDLFTLLVSETPAKCVEFGTNQGKSACFVGNIIKHWGGNLYCFDPYLNETSQDMADLEGNNTDWQYTIALQNILSFNLQGTVHLFRFRSSQAVHLISDVDFLYIDGDHSQTGVHNDMRIANQLVKNGIVLVDNFDEIGHHTLEVLPEFEGWSDPINLNKLQSYFRVNK